MSEPADNPSKPPAGGDAPEGTSPHRRRKRYAGTHPRRFEERYKELNPHQFPETVEHVRAQGRTPAGMHVPIMVAEVMEHLAPAVGEMVADCTLGYGGHAMEFMKRIGPAGRLVGFDLDGDQLERTRQRLAPLGVPMTAVRGNFAGLPKAMSREKLVGFDIIFADLGVSSMQLDDPRRGFSYKQDGPLDMRMDDRLVRTAGDLLRDISPEELSEALLDLADEEDHEAIAMAIAEARQRRPITRTGQLSEIVLRAKGLTARDWRKHSGGLHPAAKTFQALRIMVNDELGSLRALLRVAPYCLSAGGRIGIITFHSGEDRLVKKAFAENVEAGLYEEAADEVIRPGRQEVYDNPRSSGAKFRWARKAGRPEGEGKG